MLWLKMYFELLTNKIFVDVYLLPEGPVLSLCFLPASRLFLIMLLIYYLLLIAEKGKTYVLYNAVFEALPQVSDPCQQPLRSRKKMSTANIRIETIGLQPWRYPVNYQNASVPTHVLHS